MDARKPKARSERSERSGAGPADATTFTVAEANALVPWLTRQFEEVRGYVEELHELRRGMRKRPGVIFQPAPPALDRIGELERLIRSRVEEVHARGLAVRRVDGLVDIPATVGGEPGFLCWRLGEDRVTHWHPASAGYPERRPIAEAERTARL